jgi:hypothetical protein
MNRTLVDLLNDDHGYVRIFADQGGFGYERAQYSPSPMADLFDRMCGYESIALARQAAALQLQAATRARRRRLRK